MSLRPGFTLMEAMVALVIMGIVLVAFYEAVQEDLNSAGHVKDKAHESVVQANELELARAINPMTTPKGKLALGDTTLTWTSRVIEPPVPTTGYPSGNGRSSAGLYELTIVDGEGPGATVLVIKKMGWQPMTPDQLNALP